LKLADQEGNMTNSNSTTITRQQIRDLRSRAGGAGDTRQIEICTRALEGDERAVAECARVIAEASAQSAVTVIYSDGRRADYGSVTRAREMIRRQWPEAFIHCDGARTLVWACEAGSIDDPGSHAVAEIITIRT
jgi:hypothetical protein